MRRNVRITVFGIIINVLLFCIKLLGGIYSNSLALLSDSFNSLTDIVSSLAIFFAVRIGAKKADHDHPFGHHRAEPIAGLLIAILAAILGFEVIKNVLQSFFVSKSLELNVFIFIVVVLSILFKCFLFLLFYSQGKKSNSPALLASAIDSRNDIIVSFSVLISVSFGHLGYPFVDNLMAFFIGIFIIYSGFKIGIENIDFLMGKTPSKEIMERLKSIALSIEGVENLNDVRAHYIGNFIQVEVHIEVDKHLSTEKSHAISKKVQNLLEQEEIVDYAFIHVDPV